MHGRELLHKGGIPQASRYLNHRCLVRLDVPNETVEFDTLGARFARQRYNILNVAIAITDLSNFSCLALIALSFILIGLFVYDLW